MSARRTLGVFAKRPRPDEVKTRLAAATSAAWAADLAGAFLRDTLERAAGIDARRVLAFAPADALTEFEALAAGRFSLCPQRGGDLGTRMAWFFREQLIAGGPVVLMGTDSPTLPPSHIEAAFAALERHEVVLGPATDGGYYLIGCGREVPALFEGVDWGGERVLFDTVARLPSAVRLAVLPPWYDVDTLADWWALRGHVAALRRAGVDPGLPHTEPLLLFDPPAPGA